MVEALKWFIILGNTGDKDAISYTKKVGRLLSRDMQREARNKVWEWQNANPHTDPCIPVGAQSTHRRFRRLPVPSSLYCRHDPAPIDRSAFRLPQAWHRS